MQPQQSERKIPHPHTNLTSNHTLLAKIVNSAYEYRPSLLAKLNMIKSKNIESPLFRYDREQKKVNNNKISVSWSNSKKSDHRQYDPII